VSYGELATCPIADFPNLIKENTVTTGQKVFFVVTKILELMAIPLLAVVAIAWAPIGLPLFGLWFLAGRINRQYVSKFPVYERIGTLSTLPISTMVQVLQRTLIGNSTNIGNTANDELKIKMATAEKELKALLVSGLAVTALATIAAVVTVVLFFTIALIPLVVLWPAVAVCGCAAIFGLAIFGTCLWRFACIKREQKKNPDEAYEHGKQKIPDENPAYVTDTNQWI
jgi:hypothetical protein